MSEKSFTRSKKRPRTPRAPRTRRRGFSLRAWLERNGLWVALVRTLMVLFILIGLTIAWFAAQLPDIKSLETISKQQGITVLSADGHVVANYGDVYGSYIPYEELPKSLIYAVIATEDRRFFKHHGVDIIGIARAMVTNITRGRMVQGGSTVTQQVAKNVFLTPERTLKRKLQEVMLAFWLEARFSKKEIMAIYLNRVYLGGGSYGVDAAAKRYFNKSARELNLYESALFAGMLKAPSRYNPAANNERAKSRVYQVLINMEDAGFLKQKDIQPTLDHYAKSAKMHEVAGGDVRYYTDWIVDQLPELVGQATEDLIVTTTLDTKLQVLASDVLEQGVTTLGDKKRVSQGAMVVMQPGGAVLAIAGGLNYAKSPYNRAVQAKRQPGSSFKLFVYLAALEAGLTPLSMVEDAPISIMVGKKLWTPNNFESSEPRGEIPMVEAMRHSLNTVSVRLSQFTGPHKVADMAMRLGVPNVPAHPSIALGSVEATLLEMTQAYAHLPNGGNKVVAYGITQVKTRGGKEIYRYEAPAPDPVLARGTVEMMNYMLKDAATRGTGAKAALRGHQTAGKTGTSQDYKDAWFIGFTSQLVAGVWVGNDDNTRMKKITGGTIPAPIWHNFMVKALEGLPAKPIPASEGSSEGLLPWLFGVASGTPAAEAEGEAEGESTPPDEEPSPAASEDVLTPQFWEKLE